LSALAAPRTQASARRRHEPVDIVMLTHNRLDHLVAAVDALEERTPEPYRLTIVDNASDPELRSWLVENRHRFERVILRATNAGVPAFQEGIDATVSDPYIVTDPDIVVPASEPSWLSHLLALMDRHPDFGLIGLGLDPSNRPSVLEPELIDPAQLVDGEIVETGVGTVFQAIRRRALVTAYRSDGETCTAVHRAGWRVGWACNIRGLHLGWDDFRLHPGHLVSKGLDFGVAYREVGLVRPPATLTQHASAAPILAETRALGIRDAALLELSWSEPVVGATTAEALSLRSPRPPLPLADRSAGAVVLVDPPAGEALQQLEDAWRIATHAVVALAPLEAFGGQSAVTLAPEGWTAREAAGPNDILLAMAAWADSDDALADELRASLLDHSEHWRALFSAGAFSLGERRLWIWTRENAGAAPSTVDFDPSRVTRWTPEPLAVPALHKSFPKRVAERVALRGRSRVLAGLARQRVADVKNRGGRTR
jgi:glycosyl transferase family 2